MRVYRGDEKPWICVCGPHSSGTRVHTELVNELNEENGAPFFVQHHSLPMKDWPEHDFYVFVQREHDITAASQAKHRYGERGYNGWDWETQQGRPFQGFDVQVWHGIAQAALQFADSAYDGRVLHVWYGDTVQNPAGFAERAAKFFGFAAIPPNFGHQLFDGSAKYRNVVD